MKSTRLRRFVNVLARAGPLTIRTKRNVMRAVAAVDAGLCRFTQEISGHTVHDANWKINFGIELTEEGRRIAAA